MSIRRSRNRPFSSPGRQRGQESLSSPPGQETAEIPVAGAVPDEQEDAFRFALPAFFGWIGPGRRRGDRRFGAEQQSDAPLPCRDMGLDGSVEAVPVGERNPGKTEGVSLFDQLLGVARSFEEGSVALAEKGKVQGPNRLSRGLLATSSHSAQFTPRGLRETTSAVPGRRKPSRHRHVSGGRKSSRERPARPDNRRHQPPETRKGPVKL